MSVYNSQPKNEPGVRQRMNRDQPKCTGIGQKMNRHQPKTNRAQPKNEPSSAKKLPGLSQK
jgi:hypothetical protein